MAIKNWIRKKNAINNSTHDIKCKYSHINTKYVQDLNIENYKILKEIKDNLNKWEDIPYSKIESFNVVKKLYSYIEVLSPWASECDSMWRQII